MGSYYHVSLVNSFILPPSRTEHLADYFISSPLSSNLKNVFFLLHSCLFHYENRNNQERTFSHKLCQPTCKCTSHRLSFCYSLQSTFLSKANSSLCTLDPLFSLATQRQGSYSFPSSSCMINVLILGASPLRIYIHAATPPIFPSHGGEKNPMIPHLPTTTTSIFFFFALFYSKTPTIVCKGYVHFH